MCEKLPSSLSQANQIIHEQRHKINDLEATVFLLRHQLEEEMEAKYNAWKKISNLTTTSHSSS